MASRCLPIALFLLCSSLAAAEEAWQHKPVLPEAQQLQDELDRVLSKVYKPAKLGFQVKLGRQLELGVGRPNYAALLPSHRVYRARLYLEDVTVALGPEADIQGIAKSLAFGRDPAPLERLMRRYVRQGRESISLAKVLPRFARRNLGRQSTPEEGEANCFYAATSWAHHQPRMRYMSPYAFKSRLKKRFQLLQPGAAIRPGDVVVIWDSISKYPGDRSLYSGKVDPFRFKPVHAARYLGNHGGTNLFFSKPTLKAKEPCRLETSAGAVGHPFFGMGAESHPKRLVTVHRELPRRGRR